MTCAHRPQQRAWGLGVGRVPQACSQPAAGREVALGFRQAPTQALDRTARAGGKGQEVPFPARREASPALLLVPSGFGFRKWVENSRSTFPTPTGSQSFSLFLH